VNKGFYNNLSSARFAVVGVCFALCLCTFAADMAVIELPKPVRGDKNGPDIGLGAKELTERYGRNFGKKNLLVFSFNLLEKNSLDVMILINDDKAVLVSHAASKQQNTTLGDEVVAFLVKKNFPDAKWKASKDPRLLRMSPKAFESEDGTGNAWVLTKDRKQLVLSIKKK